MIPLIGALGIGIALGAALFGGGRSSGAAPIDAGIPADDTTSTKEEPGFGFAGSGISGPVSAALPADGEPLTDEESSTWAAITRQHAVHRAVRGGWPALTERIRSGLDRSWTWLIANRRLIADWLRLALDVFADGCRAHRLLSGAVDRGLLGPSPA